MRMRNDLPFTTVLTVWMLGENIRDVLPLMRRCIAFFPSRATVLPNDGSFPHDSQRLATIDIPSRSNRAARPGRPEHRR